MGRILGGPLAAYDPGQFFCELLGATAAADPATLDPSRRLILQRLAGMDLEELRRRAAVAETELYNLGITFTVYSERDAIDRILPFDILPRVLTAAEWDIVERGVIQRVAALNLFLHDIYHERKILADGVLPRDLVLGNANYRPEMEHFPVR